MGKSEKVRSYHYLLFLLPVWRSFLETTSIYPMHVAAGSLQKDVSSCSWPSKRKCCITTPSLQRLLTNSPFSMDFFGLRLLRRTHLPCFQLGELHPFRDWILSEVLRVMLPTRQQELLSFWCPRSHPNKMDKRCNKTQTLFIYESIKWLVWEAACQTARGIMPRRTRDAPIETEHPRKMACGGLLCRWEMGWWHIYNKKLYINIDSCSNMIWLTRTLLYLLECSQKWCYPYIILLECWYEEKQCNFASRLRKQSVQQVGRVVTITRLTMDASSHSSGGFCSVMMPMARLAGRTAG